MRRLYKHNTCEKLGHYIHSLISQKHFERDVERDSGSRRRKEEQERS
ncbi:hypothetical protein MtrunA17_Chr3g0090201 [Medicago truncatula]|uniref:Uncharacterized protein n=1 Tax=Medicago truncatula TaxID=3880 RepID=A0A396INK2_MEDTR|nr:hypothetical protein MtrunA17_Chr3g0090201 [Medicago truncatula]